MVRLQPSILCRILLFQKLCVPNIFSSVVLYTLALLLSTCLFDLMDGNGDIKRKAA